MYNFKPIYKTNNRLLRFIADKIFHPISMYFLDKSLRIYFRDEDGIEMMSFKLERRMNRYTKVYNLLDKPYSRYGTVYTLIKESKYEYSLDEIW